MRGYILPGQRSEVSAEHCNTFMGEMKMGNIVPREGVEHTFLAFQASVQTITPPRPPAVTTLHTSLPVYALPARSVQTTTLVPEEL